MTDIAKTIRFKVILYLTQLGIYAKEKQKIIGLGKNFVAKYLVVNRN